MSASEGIQKNISEIQERIARACERSRRSPADIRILAATKSRSIKEVQMATESGITLIGENTVQEAKSKFNFASLPTSLEKHLIGHLQTNKAKLAVELFDCIQSIDSLKLAQAIEKHAALLKKKMPILIEVNIAGEVNKFGIAPQFALEFIERISQFSHIEIQGLMTVAPFVTPENVRPYFRQMRELFDSLKKSSPQAMSWLSMGMSHDYEIAIEEGANLVRLGTAIFGPRS